ncbi:MAG TPA: hypothetical protein PKD86_03855 [Gemmatales bacterium]|nr:hypothetical protein [Gemmatales bacterium]
MNLPEPSIRVNVDPTNPGQFFACCGLLELADRLWPGAEGWFAEDGREFRMKCGGTLEVLVRSLLQAEMEPLDSENATSTRISIGQPFRTLTLDWWQDEVAGGKELKPWAGTMESFRIADALRQSLVEPRCLTESLFDVGLIAYDPENPSKKVEPYYFDARRCPNAHSRDVGFSANDLQFTTLAHPAVELMCLIGLQRALPPRTDKPRVFNYFTWTVPLPPVVLPAAVTGHIADPTSLGFRFENWFRTGQRKHKAFRSAVPLSARGDA